MSSDLTLIAPLGSSTTTLSSVQVHRSLSVLQRPFLLVIALDLFPPCTNPLFLWLLSRCTERRRSAVPVSFSTAGPTLSPTALCVFPYSSALSWPYVPERLPKLTPSVPALLRVLSETPPSHCFGTLFQTRKHFSGKEPRADPFFASFSYITLPFGSSLDPREPAEEKVYHFCFPFDWFGLPALPSSARLLPSIPDSLTASSISLLYQIV